uniref:Uncharacterized protein n=1 Tax=uncultured prokaryote TaxID=198431 RepID=A0A0H5Q603_9ZZZZ|nr:hypothetical protein [uncultured prokaryote]
MRSADDRIATRRIGYEELRLTVCREGHDRRRVVKIWHKRPGVQWKYDHLVWKASYGEMGEYGSLPALVSAAVDALLEWEDREFGD